MNDSNDFRIDLNAPHGVSDYAQRYSGNMFKLAQQQSEPRKWTDEVVKTVNDARRGLLDVEKLGERSKWRDARLMQLVKQKEELDKKDAQSLV